MEQLDNVSQSGDILEGAVKSEDEEGGQGNPNMSSAEAAAAHHKMVNILKASGKGLRNLNAKSLTASGRDYSDLLKEYIKSYWVVRD